MVSTVLNKEKIILFNYNLKNKKELKLSDIINLNFLKKELKLNKSFIFKDKKIIIKKNIYLGIKNCNNNIQQLLNLSKNKNIYKKYLDKKIISTSLEEIIKNIFIDYFILIDLYNNKIINYKYLINYLDITENNYKLNNRNYNLFKTNNLSFELNQNNFFKFKKGNNLKLKNQIIELYNKLGIKMIEIPFNYNLKNLKEFLFELLIFKNTYQIKTLNFILRFKKLKKYKKEGMFVKNENLIILDPRNIKNIYHEIGHWIYENNIPFTLNNKRIYKQNFKYIIKNYNNHNNINFNKYKKYINYDLNSEIFAIFFENNIKL